MFKEIKARRDLKGIKQSDVASHLGMPLSTYSAKERKGDFTEKEIAKVEKFVGFEKGSLMKFANQKEMDISDSIGFAVRKIIQLESMQRVLLKAVAELLASERSRATKRPVKVSAILMEMTNSVEAESAETVRLYGGDGILR
jgi:transcriptional regulator with XRE-family HTH domain